MKLIDPIAKDISFDQLIIKPELRACNIIRTDAELEKLSQALVADGIIRDPLVVWATDEGLVLVDGMTRYDLAPAAGITRAKAYMYEFEDLEEACYWVQVNQQARRNLTDLQRDYFMGVLFKEHDSKLKVMKLLRAKGLDDIAEVVLKQPKPPLVEILCEYFKVHKSRLYHCDKLARVLDKIKDKNNQIFTDLIHESVVDEKGNPYKVRLKDILALDDKHLKGSFDTWFDLAKKLEAPKEKNSESVSISSLINGYKKNPTREGYENICKVLESYLQGQEPALRKSA